MPSFCSSDCGLEGQGWLDDDIFLNDPRSLWPCGTAAVWVVAVWGCGGSFLCHSGALRVKLLPDDTE